MKQWFDKNKVWFLSLLSAVSVSVYPLLTDQSAEVTYKMIGFSALMGALGFISNSWRGQGLTLTGIIGNLAGVGAQVITTGNVSVPVLMGQLLVAIAMAAGADPKSRGYENTAVIKQAKIDGEIAQPATFTNGEVKKEAKIQANK